MKIMKKIKAKDAPKVSLIALTWLCLLLLATSTVALAEEVGTDEGNSSLYLNYTNMSDEELNKSIQSAAIEARYENVNYGYEKTLAAMEKTIEYLSNKKNISVTVLSGLKDNFTSLFENLKQYVDINDPSGFGKQVAEMHKVAAEFRSETAKVATPGFMGELRQLIQNRVREKENETEMKKIRERVNERTIAAYGFACGLNIRKIEAFAGNLSIQNMTAEEINTAAQEIKENCKNISKSNITIGNEELRIKIQALKNNFERVHARIIEKARAVNERAVERAIGIVSTLENKGANISNVEEKLEKVNEIREEVRSSCVNITSEEDKEKCKESVEQLRNLTNEIREDIVVVRNISEVAKGGLGKGKQ